MNQNQNTYTNAENSEKNNVAAQETAETGHYILPMDGNGVEWLRHLVHETLVIRETVAIGGRPVMLIRQGVSLLTNPDVVSSMMHLMQHATTLLGLHSNRDAEPYDKAFVKTLLTTRRQSLLAPVVIGVFFVTSRLVNVELRNLLSSLQMPQPMLRTAYPLGSSREVASFVKPAGNAGVPFNTDAGMALLAQNVAMCDRLSRCEPDVSKHAQGLLNPTISERGCLFMHVGQWRTFFNTMLRTGRSVHRSKDLRVLVLGMYELLQSTFDTIFDVPVGDGEVFPCTSGLDDDDKAVIMFRDEPA